MPLIGKLRTWHDDKGFGFIAPTHCGPEIFVHVSDLPRDGTRPVAGETLRYELGRGDDGRPCAVRVVRPAVGTPPSGRGRQAGARPRKRSSGMLSSVLMLALIAGAGTWGYRWFEEQSHRRLLEAQAA
jgi:cold shock CspA family protein